MNLDEMKNLWSETETTQRALLSALRRHERLAKVNQFERIRTKLGFVHRVLWYELASGVLVALLVGSYLVDHLGDLWFALPAAVLHLGAILTIGVAVRQLVALSQIDYSQPVVAIQRRLASLAALRARANRTILLASPLLWALLVVLVPDALIGLDVYDAFGLPWVAGNLVFGVIVIGAAFWVRWRYPSWVRSSTLIGCLGDDLTGRRLALVSSFLEDIEEFAFED